MSKVIIIGGGASGIICAIEVSKNNDVILIEKNNKLAKKLLLTGNGKCNFTNLNISKENISRYYNTNYFDNSFLTFDNKKLIEYFKNIGLESRIFIPDDIRYVYPITNKSKDLYFFCIIKLLKQM